MERLHAIVTGRVQGVCFRAWTQESALNLGLVGWVRNLPQGSVEVLSEGERPILDQFVQKLYSGPPAAKVVEVHSEFSPAAGDLGSFQIRYE